ncbi:MAG: hypothetical protein WC906_04790, partial [Parcubacteria group bacterium]
MKIKNKILIKILIVPVTIGIALGFTFSFAQTPNGINVTAYIVNSENKEIANGEYDIRFALYSTDRTEIDQYPSVSDLRVWEETQKVKIADGYINAYLGSTTPLPDSVSFSKNSYYLGIRIGTDSEMVPRKKVGAVPLAIDSMRVQGMVPGTSSGNLAILGTGGKINIKQLPTGTSGNKLLLASDLPSEQDEVTFSGSYDYLTLSGQEITLDQINLGTDVAGMLGVSNGGTNLTTIGDAGSVAYSDGTSFEFTGVGVAGQVLTSNGAGAPTWGNQTITLSGDVTGSGTTSITTTIADNSVDGTDIALGSDAQGDVMYYNGTDWARLPAGTSGYYLQTQGTGANPKWATATAGTSDWSQVAGSPNITYLTDTTSDFIVGAATSAAPFFFDTSEASLTLGVEGASGSLALVSDQATNYTATLNPNTAMTSNASFYLPADEPAGTYLLTMTTGGVMGYDSNTYITGNQTITLSGDVTGSGTTSITTTIADNSVDGSDIALGSDEQGDIMYYDGTNWVALVHGTSGNLLQSGGHGGNPSWIASGGVGNSKWIDATTYTYLTAVTEDLVIGSTTATAPFFFDTSEASLTLGVEGASGSLALVSDQATNYTATLNPNTA